MFAVVDIETTGGHPAGHGITEIAVVIHDGVREVDRYSTLLNPGQAIPLSIQALTGITPDMVSSAPTFEEVATELRTFLGDHTFVAHNVNFDYSFVKAAFTKCGIDYNPKRLCSVRYARRIEKGLRSYSLSNLCRHFGVRNEAAHRAWGDAIATSVILSTLLEKDVQGQWQHLIKKNSGEFNLPANLPSEDYHALPERPGVYYFMDRSGKPVYIGKASNLKKRVATHFISDKETKRSQAFKREIHQIRFEETGSELVASLLEDHEIRHYWPPHNRAQKNPKRRYGVYLFYNQNRIGCLAINRISSQKGFLIEFYTQHEATGWVYEMVLKFELDPARCGFPATVTDYEVDDELHNERLRDLLEFLDNQKQSYLIKVPGRNHEEDGFVMVQHGHLTGIGFVSREFELHSNEELTDYLRPLRSSITTQSILEKTLSSDSHQIISQTTGHRYSTTLSSLAF